MDPNQRAKAGGEPLIIGVDQRPFVAGVNHFCLGYPLLLEESGDVLDPAAFENRGRIWWKVDNIPESELIPGSLHVAEIEPAPAFDPTKEEKDRYQIRLQGRRPSSENWFEVVRVDGDMPGIDRLFSDGVPTTRRPLKRVLLHFDDGVVGPFFGLWEASRSILSFRHLDGSAAEVSRVPWSKLESSAGLRRFSWTANRFDRSAATEDVGVMLLSASGWGELADGAEAIDAMPLDEIAYSFQKQLRMSDFKREIHDEPLERIRAMGSGGDERQAARIERLERALDQMRAGSDEARRFTPKVRARLQSFLPPSPASSPPEIAPAPASPAPATGSESREPDPARSKARSAPEGDHDGLSEPEFFAHLIEAIAGTGYKFEQRDLLGFHLGLKASPLCILAGRSGVGKSSLPRLYAAALGSEASLLPIAVRPDWLDDQDVVGAFDSLSKRYRPAATGLVDFLIAAAEDEAAGRGGPAIALLDEMNLARVEYYFASFLSALEQPAPRRGLRLFAERAVEEGDPYAAHGWLPLPDRLRIVGTVNVDETTHLFSPKVLDRASVQTFAAPDLRRVASVTNETIQPPRVPVTWERWSSWIGRGGDTEPWVQEQLAELNDLLVPLASGFGYRTLHRVLGFVAGARELQDYCTPQQALDLAIVQFVLPRLRTDLPGFMDVVDSLLGSLAQGEFPETHGLLERMRDLGGAGDFWQLG